MNVARWFVSALWFGELTALKDHQPEDPRRWDLQPMIYAGPVTAVAQAAIQGHDLDTPNNMWRRSRATSRCAEQQPTEYSPHGTTGPTHRDVTQAYHEMQREPDQEAGTESRSAQGITPMAQLPPPTQWPVL